MSPPNYPIGGGYAPATLPPRPIRTVARALVTRQIIAAVSAGLVLVLQIALVNRADDFIGGTTDEGRFEDAIGPFLAVSLLAGRAAATMPVLLIIWSYRIAHHLQRLRRSH